jgi:hypothetical protein
LEQAQPPPQPQPPDAVARAESEVAAPVTAKVENSALVFVPSQEGQTWRSPRALNLPSTSNLWRQVRQENS